MIEGTLIAESLRVGTNLENLKLTVRKISKYRAQGTTPHQPDIWTTLDFEADEAEAPELAEAFADTVDDPPGCYVKFQSATDSFVVFPNRIYRYPRGDQTYPGRRPGLRPPARHPRAAAGLDGVRQQRS